MKEKTKRQYQIGESIKRNLSNIFREGIFEHKIKDIFSIMEVSPSPGYRTAWVFISALDPLKNEELVNALNEIANEVRYELANRANMKTTPSLVFKLDNALEYANNIEKLLNLPEVQEDLK